MNYQLKPRRSSPTNRPLTTSALRVGLYKGSPSDNFSFANFDWVGFQDHQNVEGDTTLGAMASEAADSGLSMGSYDSSIRYTWFPCRVSLEDGSETIAFKLRSPDAGRLAQMTANNDPGSEKKAQDILLHSATEVITTPSKSDRMRGVRPDTIVVRTPSSLIDLLDDEVPDLRQGFFMDPMPRSSVAAFSGGPESAILGPIMQFDWDLIQAIYDKIRDEAGDEFTMTGLVKAVAPLTLNVLPGVALTKIIRGIYNGHLNEYLTRHRDGNIYDTIIDWLSDELRGAAGDVSTLDYADRGPYADRKKPELEVPKGRPLSKRMEDILKRSQGEENADQSWDDESDWTNSSDRDCAYVPISYWRRLYAMGSCFRRRNSIPDFSTLVLSGSPSRDLLLNRVPSIYIHPDGRISNEYWLYGTYPLAGGLFKKIGQAVKKVGKAVAKGVSKVMDSPLGNVIKAIPGVGTVASVAGGVAKVANKLLGDDEKPSESAEAQLDVSPAEVNVPNEPESHGTGLLVGEKSDVVLREGPRISVDSLPTWEATPDIPYVAPTMTMLTSDPNTGLLPVTITSADEADERERLVMGTISRLNLLRDMMKELDARGPLKMYQLSHGSLAPLESIKIPSEFEGLFLAGAPKVEKGADCISGHRWYWQAKTPYTRLRRRTPTFAGDPDPRLAQQMLDQAFSQFQPMAEWTGCELLTKNDSYVNPFPSAFFQLSKNGKTKEIFRNGTPSSAGLASYVFDAPVLSRIKDRHLDQDSIVEAAITWACVLCADRSLSENKRNEIATAMKPAIMSGMLNNKGVDDLLQLCLSGEWPNGEEILQPNVAKAWTRMLAACILYIWFEAVSGQTNSFSEAITRVMTPSREAVSVMNSTLTSDGSEPATPSRPSETDKGDASEAEKLLNRLLNANSERAEDGEYVDPNGGLAAPSDDGPFASDQEQWSRQAGDYWLLASRICKASLSEDSAARRMQMDGLPNFIISMALQRYFPTAATGLSPVAPIPLSRRDYFLFPEC